MTNGNQTQQIWSALDTVTDPELDESVTSLEFITLVEVQPESNVRIQKRRLSVSAGLHLDVEQVSGVRTFGIVFSVFPRSRVEMSPRADKIRTFTLANGMDVNAMGAGRQLRNM